MNIEAVLSAYRRYARIYDVIFGPIMHPARRRIVAALGCRQGDRVLEVGVGTGLSLPLYAGDVQVTGIDISTEMLAKARQRVEKLGLKQVKAVIEMDAEAMQFADNSFDKVVAMYVVSVAPRPDLVVEEMRRVCKPGGDIFIVNHFRSENPVLRFLEGMFAPLSKLAGFRPDMDLNEFIRTTGLDVVEISGANLFGYWKILRCQKTAIQKSIPAEAAVGGALESSASRRKTAGA